MDIHVQRTGIESKFYDLAVKVTQENGLKLYDMEYHPGQSLLRFYIYDEESGTAQLDDCAKIDRAMSPYCEEADWMPQELVLEVSSPGIYRHIKTLEHFQDALNKRIKIVLKSKMRKEDERFDLFKGQKAISGVLVEINENSIQLELPEGKVSFEYDELKKSNLDPEI